ncbi:MAG: hypothetical protein K6E11_03650 [Bacilli bacterium]|nr:hypothetical protein [Bacilli bacterium]
MKKKLLITTAVLSLAATLAVGAAVGLGKEALKADATPQSYNCTELDVVDQAGWSFRTLWLDGFGYSSGYSSTDLDEFIQDYYGTDLSSSWDKEGSTRGYKKYGTGYNLCAGGTSGTYEFIFPEWLEYFSIQVENNGNNRYFNYLNNLTSAEQSSAGNGHGKVVTLYCKDNSQGENKNSWVNIGSAATTTDFDTTVNVIAKTDASTQVGSGSIQVNKYEHYSSEFAVSGYTFLDWYTDASLNTAFSGLIGSKTTLYAKMTSLPALSTPVLTKGSDNSITWAAVANAQSYEVTVDGGTPYSVSTSATRRVEGIIKPGTHTISVVAKGDNVNYVDSVAGSESYTVDAGFFLVGSFQPTAFSEDLVGAVRMSAVSGQENTYQGDVTLAANAQVEAVYSTSSQVDWQNWGSLVIDPAYAASEYPVTQGGTYNKSVVVTNAGNYRFKVTFENNAAHYVVTPLDYTSSYKLVIGSTEYPLVLNSGNEFKVENVSLTRGDVLGYKDGSTTISDSTSKLICNNNLDEGKKVMFSKENATIYVDVVAKTIFTELPSSVTSVGAGYHVIKNGSSIITMTQNQAPADPSYLEYYTEVTSFAANDVLTFLDLKTSGEVRTVEFKITTINAGGLGDKFETTADGIRAKEAIQAAVYLKLKSGADEVYFGDVSEAVRKATEYASNFITKINAICDTTHGTGTDFDDLAEEWGKQKVAYTALASTDGAQKRLQDATLDDSVAEIRTFLNQYKYVIEKYGSRLQTELGYNPDFIGHGYSQQTLSGYGINRVVNTSNTIAIIVVISVVAITSIGGFMFIKTRKHD